VAIDMGLAYIAAVQKGCRHATGGLRHELAQF
jgi:hypothetical protein